MATRNKENSGNSAAAIFVGILFALLCYPYVKPFFDGIMMEISNRIAGK